LAILAAVSFAFGSVLQQKGTLQTNAAEGDPRFLAEIVREPIWLLGAGCQAIGWVLQAIALKTGTLVVVQSLCALSIVLALPLGARLTAQQITRRTIAGALLALGGIIVFVALGQPANGITNPPASTWWLSAIGSLVLIGVFTAIGRRRGGPVAAVLYAGAAGICFA
jgi:drug/metabolite transporter (DMT)-like permease